MKMPQWIYHMRLGQAVRMITTCCATLVIAYNLAQPFVEAWAGDAFVEALKNKGVDPADFASMKKQGIDNGNDIDKVSNDTEKIKEKLIGVTSKVEALNTRLDEIQKGNDKVEGLVQKLLEIQLNKRADTSFSPPGTGPVGVPRFGSLQ